MRNANETNPCRRIATGVVRAGFLLLALVCGGAYAFSTAPYFPLSQGAQWSYSSTTDGNFNQNVSRNDSVSGYPVVVLLDSLGREQYYSNDANGIRVHGFFDPNVVFSGIGTFQETGVVSPPQLLLSADATLGVPVTSGGQITVAYTSASIVLSFQGTYASTSTPQGFETITVPAGTFNNVLRVQTVTTLSGTLSGPSGTASLNSSNVDTVWLVSGVGVIYEISETSSEGEPPYTNTTVLNSSNLIDSTPNGFSFQPQFNVLQNSVLTSNTVTVSGISVPTAISITGGQYSINGGAYTSAAGTLSNGDSVAVQVTSAGTPGTLTSATLMVGGVSATFQVRTQVPPGVSALFFISQPGDYIGQGQTTMLVDGSQYSITGSRNPSNGVSFQITDASTAFRLNFAAPAGAELMPGTYEGAVRYPFQNGLSPGLDLSGDGRGCNIISGRFVVLEAVYSGGGELQRFAANFVQHCEGSLPALLGQIRYRSNVPIDFSTVPDAPTVLSVTAGSGSAVVSFMPPANNGGAAITQYTVTSSPAGGVAATGSSSPIQVTGLGNGTTYTFTVTATNSIGTGPASGASNPITTAPADAVPDAFTLVSQTQVIAGRTATSNAVTVSGINAPTSISITGGTYSVNSRPYVAASGTVQNGDTVRVQLIASSSVKTQTCATLTIGGQSGQFCATTGLLTLQQALSLIQILLDDD